jgi:hypothetical protein
MEMETPNRERALLRTLQPRGIIFGFSLGLFVLTYIHDYHFQTLYPGPPVHGAGEDQFATFLLVIASLGLVLRRWWSHLIAIVLGGKIVYNPGYLTLWLYANVSMSDGSLLRFATWKGWYYFTLETQPQYLLHTLVGGVICCYAAIELMRQVLRFNRTRANKALQLTAR